MLLRTSAKIRWSLVPERQWVAELMGNDQPVKSLIESLQATEIRGREGVNERSKEREIRADKARRERN